MTIPNTKRQPNNAKTDQFPIFEVITGLPRPYLHTCALSPVKERHATIGREGVSSTVNRNLCGKRGVVESNDTADEAGAMFW